MSPVREQELLVGAFEVLRGLLEDDDGMELKPYPGELPAGGPEAVWEVSAPNYSSPLLVQAFRRFTPRDVDRVLGGISPLVRQIMRDPPILVVAPWLSPRSRELLTEHRLNYLDLTGNVRLRVLRPAIRLRLDGAQHDPNPRTRPSVRLQGTSINALVRILVDVAPPYRMVDLARASGLSNAYISRSLEALHEENLINRPPASKVVEDVDWQGLLRARADQYDLFKSNEAHTFVARTGAGTLYRRLGLSQEDQAVVTGSFAAIEYVQLAAPAQLALYVPNAEAFAGQYGLMSSRQGGDVVLLRAASDSQIGRSRFVASGTYHVGTSQLALDCLSGNGRLPEEGDALLIWMAENVSAWRLPDLHHLTVVSRGV